VCIRGVGIGIPRRAMDVSVGGGRRRDGLVHRRYQAMGESISRAKLTLQSAQAF
jgi:hypothetical protein